MRLTRALFLVCLLVGFSINLKADPIADDNPPTGTDPIATFDGPGSPVTDTPIPSPPTSITESGGCFLTCYVAFGYGVRYAGRQYLFTSCSVERGVTFCNYS